MTEILSTAERIEYLRLLLKYGTPTPEQSAEYHRLVETRDRRAARRKIANAARKEHRAMNKGRSALDASKRWAAYFPGYVGTGDIDLAELAGLADTYDRALGLAVVALIEQGYSWTDVGNQLGVTRQAAQKRFGHLVKSTRQSGGQPANLR